MLSDKRRQMNQNSLGSALKDARQAMGYTQKALADALGLEYYVMVSQMELGYMNIPAPLWTPIADKLRLNRAQWVTRCLQEIQPEVFKAIFGNKSRAEVEQLLTLLDKGDSRLDEKPEPTPIEPNTGRAKGNKVTPSRYR